MSGLTLKERLAQKERKLFGTVDIDGETVELRRPTNKERFTCIRLSREAGEVDAQNQPTSEEGGLRMLARMVASTLFDPASKGRLYDPANAADVEAVMGAPWLEDVQQKATEAFKGNLVQSLEEARGNS